MTTEDKDEDTATRQWPRRPKVATIEVCQCSHRKASSGGTNQAKKWLLKPRPAKMESLWTLEREVVREGKEVDPTRFLFTFEDISRDEVCSSRPALIIRSVSSGGRVLCLDTRTAGRRGRSKVVLRGYGEGKRVDDRGVWFVLETSEDGKSKGNQIVLANKARPQTRIGPTCIHFLDRVSSRFLLGSSSAPAQDSGKKEAEEEAALVSEAKRLISRLETLVGDEAGVSGRDGLAPTRTLQEDLEGEDFVPKARSRPRKGNKWLETPVSSRRSAEDGGSLAISAEKTISLRTPAIAGPCEEVTSQRVTEAAPAPMTRGRMPVPLQQNLNILAQIRQGVKLHPPAAKFGGKGRRGNPHEVTGLENVHPSVAFTPTPMSTGKQSSGLMTELRRSLAGRRKSMGEGAYTPCSETEESCNWSPLSVNT
ncbi:hypothetical protein HOP50_18g81170 [Chloropicon primus]|uniref:Uncharacterized protein n=1 Tax=Chloropicon primus TaxID=1764295 RepID=A0A5B8N0X8_9CHLO|nr:hypothetical protein A3770_18p80930 [Chloropicon primus]UPR04772.1 hypothetical protein HOP50_18g81170 [Chloropicon primus]|eukprot:QDZ25575.1 hypothetical protein A3770_18p80930 [Chloropicon primus]